MVKCVGIDACLPVNLHAARYAYCVDIHTSYVHMYTCKKDADPHIHALCI